MMPESQEGWRATLRTLSLVGNLGFQIAVPVVVLAVGGRLLDRKLGTSPWFLLGGIFASIAMSSFLVIKRILPLLSEETPTPNPPKESDSPAAQDSSIHIKS